MRNALIIIGFITVGVGAWIYFNGGLMPRAVFDPEAASNEIINSLGASTLRRDLVTAAVCGAPLIGDSQMHTQTPHQAREHIDAVMDATNARPTSPWDSSSVGYTRIWRYGQNDYGSYMVMVTNNMLNINWRELDFLKP